MLRLIAFLCFLTTPALAGPWIRAEGEQFISLSIEGKVVGADMSSYGSLYYEYGLGPRLTLGLDAGGAHVDPTTSLVFVRTPLWRAENGARMSFDLALGSVQSGADSSFALRPGVSWGRELKGRPGGWVSVDLTHRWLADHGQSLSKLEGTAGVPWGARRKVMMQMTIEKASGLGWSSSLTPSIAWRVHDNLELITGLTIRDDRSVALKLGLWRRF